jgi:hypothetical protein
VAATKKIAPVITVFNGVEVCRDESCYIIEVHAAHSIATSRGAPPKHCPLCNEPIPRGQGAHCKPCGWDRRGHTYVQRKRE